MMRKLLLHSALLVLGATTTLAQDPVEATLYTRTVQDPAGDVVRAALVLEVEPGWHIYHGPKRSDLGHPNAVGAPTIITLAGEGITWGEVRYPEPYEEDQSDIEEGVYINAHHDTVIFYAAGRLGKGLSAADISAKVKGLACDLSCIPFRATVKAEGAGADSLWSDLPADLPVPAPAKPTEPVPTRDKIKSGEADATLYTRVVDGRVQAALEIDINPGWHLYHKEKGNPAGIGKVAKLELKGADVVWGEPLWPEPEEVDQSDIEEGLWIWGHEDRIVIYALGELAEGADGQGLFGSIAGQTCEDSCIPYKETFVSRGAGRASVWSDFPLAELLRSGAGEADTEDGAENVTGGETPPQDGAGALGASLGTDESGSGGEEQEPLGAFLLEAVLWGLITLLMPCTYPMIPITISFFTKQADSRGGKVMPLSLAYGAGIILVFIVIGVVVGQVIVPFAQHPVTNLTIGVLFFVFALSLFGMINIQPPSFLMNAAGKASMKGGYAGVFLMGTTLVVTSFTCTAPFVGTLLAHGAADGSLGRVVLGMGVFGLTMAIPFVFLSLVPKKIQAMPKSGEWMNTLKVTLGFVELAAALKFISNADLGWGWSVLSREFFLILWAVIFVLCGLYLFGAFWSHGPIGTGRRVSGLVSVVFAAYCGWAAAGHETDVIMSSIAPPYSGGRVFPSWYEFGGDWAIVKDQYEEATELAASEGKLVLLNFTGFT